MSQALADRVTAFFKCGVFLWVVDGRLQYRAEAGVLTPDDLLWLQANKKGVALACLERERSHLRWQYRLCREGERMPHYRTLSAECLAEGKRAFKRMELQMRNLENDIIRLTCSNSFYSP